MLIYILNLKKHNMKARIYNNEWLGNHLDSWLNTNQNIVIGGELVSEWQLTEVLPNTDLMKPIWNGTEWIEGLTENELQSIQIEKAIKEETEMYRKRQCDGVLAYAEISAEFRLAKLSGILTEEQHGAIESVLIPVRNEVLAGQWISAKQKLEEIGIVIGADLYNRLHTQITNYIAENY